MKHDKEFLEMSFEFEYLYIDYERLWMACDSGQMPNSEVEDKFYEFREKEVAIEKAHKQASCPRFEKLITKAELEAKNALAINFN